MHWFQPSDGHGVVLHTLGDARITSIFYCVGTGVPGTSLQSILHKTTLYYFRTALLVVVSSTALLMFCRVRSPERVDLSSHTLALSPDGVLRFVPLHPSQIKPVKISTSRIRSQPIAVEEQISAEAAAPDVEMSPTSAKVQFSGSLNSPDMQTSATLPAPAAINVSDGAVDGPDAGVTTRRKRKGFSLPGFGRKSRPRSSGGGTGNPQTTSDSPTTPGKKGLSVEHYLSYDHWSAFSNEFIQRYTKSASLFHQL